MNDLLLQQVPPEMLKGYHEVAFDFTEIPYHGQTQSKGRVQLGDPRERRHDQRRLIFTWGQVTGKVSLDGAVGFSS
jgi:hypothetical protein